MSEVILDTITGKSTATTGTTVVLVQAASLNDIVEMVVYDTFSVADSYTKSE